LKVNEKIFTINTKTFNLVQGLSPEMPSEMIGNDCKNNGSVLTGKGSFYAHTNQLSSRPIEDISNYQQSSPGAKGTSMSLITLVPSSSTTSSTTKHRNLQKTGSVSR